MSIYAATSKPLFEGQGLSAFTFRTAPGHQYPSESGHSHTHMELEMILVQRDAYVLDLSGRHEQVDVGEIAIFWAGLPHRGEGRSVGAVYHVVQVPIVHVLSWGGSAAIIDNLLGGALFRIVATAVDTLLFARWCADLVSDDPQLQAIVELEIHGRLRRYFYQLAQNRHGPAEHATTATATGVATAIRYVIGHFMQRITIDDIANAAGWDRYHLMHSFRRICGLTVWEYVIRVRLAEAQRLLAATDLPTSSICDRADFSSVSRMYDSFHRYYQLTPSEYRNVARS